MDNLEIKRKFLSSINQLMNQNSIKECFHEDENCGGKIIKAHSIQNNKILSKISEEGYVLMFTHDLDDAFEMESVITRKGRKVATTFTGFCGYHDKKIFEPIEDADYEPGNVEQEFLFAYRALAKEYHAKISSTNMVKNVLELIGKQEYSKVNNLFENYEPTPQHLLHMNMTFKAFLIGAEDAEQRLTRHRGWMNNWLDSSNYNEVITDIIIFDEEFDIAVTSTATIEQDLAGKTINDLGDWNTSIAPTFITVFPQNGKTFILLSYFKRNQRRYSFIKDQIVSKDTSEQKIILSNIIISYVENIALSPNLWSKYSKETQNFIQGKFLDTAFEHDKPLIFDKKLNLFL